MPNHNVCALRWKLQDGTCRAWRQTLRGRTSPQKVQCTASEPAYCHAARGLLGTSGITSVCCLLGSSAPRRLARLLLLELCGPPALSGRFGLLPMIAEKQVVVADACKHASLRSLHRRKNLNMQTALSARVSATRGTFAWPSAYQISGPRDARSVWRASWSCRSQTSRSTY